ncbi:MAG: hypothetical protein L0Z55_08975, partial [Planctomycetes bacterium]|nr:hypothetical protein [Planctomycetota bacterium]
KEGYQWAVLAGLVALVAAAAVTGGAARVRAAPRAGDTAAARSGARAANGAHRAASASAPRQTAGAAALTIIIVALVGAWPGNALAEPAPETDPAEGGGAESTAATTPALPPPPSDALAAYNESLALLTSNDLARAEQFLNAAHAGAGADNRVRYRASYNLGWLFHERARAKLDSDPKQALQELYTAANWFREAVRLYPKEKDPRQNLEAVLKKALALADSLAERNETLEARVEALIAAERAQAAEIAGVAERSARADANAATPEAAECQRLAGSQRTVISDAGIVVDAAVAEQQTLAAKPEEERTPEEKIRAVQLANLVEHLHRAQERLGQCRSQLRKKIPERAYRRATAAVAALKRARDQLRDPLEMLGAIIPDAIEQLRYAGALAEAGAAAPAPAEIPVWLTAEYLREEMEEIWQRADTLRRMLEAGVSAREREAATSEDVTGEDASSKDGAAPQSLTPEEERLLATVKEALPYLSRGTEAFDRARGALDRAAAAEAYAAEEEGVGALLNAQELFLDLRGLIEAAYAGEEQQRRILSAKEEELPAEWSEILPALVELNKKDAVRSERIGKLIEEEVAKLAPDSGAGTEAGASAGAGAAPGSGAEAERADAERERYRIARALLSRTQSALADAAAGYERSANLAGEEYARAAGEAKPAVEKAVKGLEELRRLFFSLVEHLRETARREGELVDEVAQAKGIGGENERAEKLGPLVPRQEELATLAEEIAAVLKKQSEQPLPQEPPAAAAKPATPGGKGAGPDPEKARAAAAAEQQRKLARAAELVTAANDEMGEVVAALQAALPPLEQAETHGDNATKHLIDALALLTPPEQQEQGGNQQQQQQQQAAQQEEDRKKEKSSDPAQQLQSVRDREAERRAERDRNKISPYDPVEKDW